MTDTAKLIERARRANADSPTAYLLLTIRELIAALDAASEGEVRPSVPRDEDAERLPPPAVEGAGLKPCPECGATWCDGRRHAPATAGSGTITVPTIPIDEAASAEMDRAMDEYWGSQPRRKLVPAAPAAATGETVREAVANLRSVILDWEGSQGRPDLIAHQSLDALECALAKPGAGRGVDDARTAEWLAYFPIVPERAPDGDGFMVGAAGAAAIRREMASRLPRTNPNDAKGA